MNESDFAPLGKQKKVQFDPTINLGHILTIITLILLGLGAWSMLDKRVVVLALSRTMNLKATPTYKQAQIAALRALL